MDYVGPPDLTLDMFLHPTQKKLSDNPGSMLVLQVWAILLGDPIPKSRSTHKRGISHQRSRLGMQQTESAQPKMLHNLGTAGLAKSFTIR